MFVVCGYMLPLVILEGKFRNIWSPWGPVNRGGKCPQIPHSRAQLGGANVTSQRDSTSTKGKMMALLCESEENLGEASAGSSCPCWHWKPSWCQYHMLQESGHSAKLCWSLLLLWKLLPSWGVSSTPVIITNQMQAASALSSVLTDPRGDHQSHKGVLQQPAYCCSRSHRLSPVLCGHCHPHSKRGAPGVWCGHTGLGILHLWGSISGAHLCEVRSCLCFIRDPEETEKEEQVALISLRLRRNFRVNESLQVPSLFLLNRRLQTGLQAQMATVPSSSCSWRTTVLCSPLKAGLQLLWLRPLTRQEQQPQWSYTAPSHTLKEKM